METPFLRGETSVSSPEELVPNCQGSEQFKSQLKGFIACRRERLISEWLKWVSWARWWSDIMSEQPLCPPYTQCPHRSSGPTFSGRGQKAQCNLKLQGFSTRVLRESHLLRETTAA